MSKVPVITSPCPLRFKTAPSDGMDFCSQCQRRVHNLDGMSDGERQVFFASCAGDVCVSYTVKRTVKIAALSLATMGAVASAAAYAQQVTMNDPPSPHCETRVELDIIVGGTNAGKDLQWVDESEAKMPDKENLPEIAASDWLPSPEK